MTFYRIVLVARSLKVLIKYWGVSESQSDD